jgi:hypothetical protein
MRKTIDDVLDRGNKLDGEFWWDCILHIFTSKLPIYLYYPFCIIHIYIYIYILIRTDVILPIYCTDVSDMSKNLVNESKQYKWGAKKLSTMVIRIIILKKNVYIYNLLFNITQSYQALWKQYAPLVVIVLIIVLVLIVRYFWR